MATITQRLGDCKSSIHRFDSDPRLHPDLSNLGLTELKSFVQISSFLSISVNIMVNYRSNKTALKFVYKNTKYTVPLNCTISELTDKDVQDIVTRKIREVDNVVTLAKLFDFILDCKNGCGANKATRKKSVGHIKDVLKRDGIELTESTNILLREDELGRTLPERWSELWGLPHKLRQIKALFSKKNLSLFSRQGWEVKHFGNFVSFSAKSTISQPFTTSDNEVETIIKFFKENKDKHPVFYDIYLLAFGCGLRKSEIYQVKQEHFTVFNNQHFLLLPFATKRTKIKGVDYVEKVGISKQVYDHFISREGKIINGGERLHKRFTQFLKTELGIQDNKPTHRLRKILGARLATSAGIYHASKTLRNSVAVCEKYYSDLTAHRNELEV